MLRFLWACVVAALASLVSIGVWAEPPTSQQTLAQPAVITASSAALTGPFGPGSILDAYNKTPQALEGTLYPVEAFVVAMGQAFTGMEPPIQVRMAAATWFAAWEAVVPYTDNSVGIFLGGQLRRPAVERNEVSRGIAAAYALYKYANFILPANKAQFDAVMKQLALPLTSSEDPSSPAGVGNRAGRAVLEFLATDGFNQLGDLGHGFTDGSTAYNYTDYPPLYKPVNTYDALNDASRWQPLVLQPANSPNALGAPYIQVHITPQIGRAKHLAFAGELPRPPPPSASLVPGSAAYRAQVDQIINVQAKLTDVQKMQAEFFDVKTLSLGVALLQNKVVLTKYKPLKLVDLIRLELAAGLALYDANSVVWGNKVYFDAIRPISAIRYTYGDNPITAWLGPGKGTGANTGNGYRSYLRTMQHSDYPSGSGCYCAAWGKALQDFLGDDELGFSILYKAGSSKIDIDVPKKDVILSWATLSDYVQQCRWSRVLGGVHFEAATLAAVDLCTPIGKAAALRVNALYAGKDTGPIPASTLVSK